MRAQMVYNYLSRPFILFLFLISFTLKGNEMLWSIGYRGLNDYPFWNDDPEVNTDLKRAAVINQAMANQTALVKRLLPNSNVRTHLFYLYSAE